MWLTSDVGFRALTSAQDAPYWWRRSRQGSGAGSGLHPARARFGLKNTLVPSTSRRVTGEDRTVHGRQHREGGAGSVAVKDELQRVADRTRRLLDAVRQVTLEEFRTEDAHF